MNPRTTAATGLIVTLAAAALIASTASFSLGAGLIVGIAAGASVALVPSETGPRKLAGFLTGILVAAGMYVLRAGLLPDAMIGTLVAIVGLFAVITVISLISAGRVPLWASFAGVAAMAGAYETLHILDFAALMTNLPIALVSVLLASAVGFTAGSLFAPAKATQADAELTADDEDVDFETRRLYVA